MSERVLAFLCLALPACLSAGCDRRAGAAPPAAAAAKPPAGEVWLTPKEARAAGIALATVAFRQIDRELVASGRITFDDQRVTHVFSPVNGRVVRLLAQPGQRIRRGDPLALIESPDVGSAFSEHSKAQAALDAAERELQRQQELYAVRAAAQRDLEAAQSSERQARAELERAAEKARLLGGGSVRRVTQAFVLRSPLDGEVIARAANPGVEVQGQYSGGTAVELFTVGELDRVWAMGDVFEADLAHLAVGAPAAVEVVAFPGRKFPGRVDWISSAVDPATRTARVRCAIHNPDRALKAEMYATLSIQVAGRAALAVPRGAVLRQGDQTVVFRALGAARNGALRFERLPVRVEDEGSDASLPVLSGLRSGDRVVTAGAVLLLGLV